MLFARKLSSSPEYFNVRWHQRLPFINLHQKILHLYHDCLKSNLSLTLSKQLALVKTLTSNVYSWHYEKFGSWITLWLLEETLSLVVQQSGWRISLKTNFDCILNCLIDVSILCFRMIIYSTKNVRDLEYLFFLVKTEHKIS